MKGQISITKFTSNQEPRRGFHIELEDDSSGLKLFRVMLTYEQFAECINGPTDCEYEMYKGVELAGKTREVKHVMIDVSGIQAFWKISDEEGQKLLEPYNIDSWQGSLYDLKNHHNRKGNIVKVGFIRFV